MADREDHLSEVRGWEEGVCQDCGLSFPRRQRYERRCPLCFKVERGYKVLWGDQAFLWAQEQMKELLLELQKTRSALKMEQRRSRHPRPSGLEGDLLRQAILLCHPDKHKGSEKATKVTQALLALREKEPKKRKKK